MQVRSIFCLFIGFVACRQPPTNAPTLPADVGPVSVDASMVRVAGQIVPTSIRLAPGQVEQVRLHYPDASFVKVHFDDFNLPPDATVVVSNADQSEVYRYQQQLRSPMTIDRGRGDDGQRRFSSLSITGETALVQLLAAPSAWFSGRHRVHISQVLRGVAAAGAGIDSGLVPGAVSGRSVCGGDDKRDVACYAQSQPISHARSQAVARLLVGSLSCTAWRIGPGNRFLTNNHCMSTPSSVQAAEVWFGYEHRSCGGSSTGAVVKVTGRSLLHTDYALDMTLFTVNQLERIGAFGSLGIDPRMPTKGEEIYIPQHSGGDPKVLAIESDKNPGTVCRIDQASADGRAQGTDTGYFCDTNHGSSGAPVLARSSHQVVALHHYGGCFNLGVQMAQVWPLLKPYFADLVPLGHPPNQLQNRQPVAGFSHTSEGPQFRFHDLSSDPDGMIRDRVWYFGDGTQSTVRDPQHTFLASGKYKVRLTVVDEQGAPASIAQDLRVVNEINGIGVLQRGRLVDQVSADAGTWRHFKLEVGSQASDLTVDLDGGTGNADLYTRWGQPPTKSDYLCRSRRSSNKESCWVTQPQTGTLFVGLVGHSAFSGVRLLASYSLPQDENGHTHNNLSGYWDDWHYVTIDVPFETEMLTVTSKGGVGDCDLFVGFGREPTNDNWSCASERSGNQERCVLSQPRAGRWYVGLFGYNDFEDVELSIRTY